MTKGIIYYTNNNLSEIIFKTVQDQIEKTNLEIITVSQKPINFGKNYVLNLKPGIVSMLEQITFALEKSSTDYVFFCEHDVLYPLSHFDFTPQNDNIFYYNSNVWRWDYPQNRAITYDRLISLSGLATNRNLALKHYKNRLEEIYKNGFDKNTSHEPTWARRWGYEPGTKKKKRGGFSDDDFETWTSKAPLIDIRHDKTFSPRKISQDKFKHKPTGWVECSLENIPGWDLKSLFKIPF